jgi:hypothetical protein
MNKQQLFENTLYESKFLDKLQSACDYIRSFGVLVPLEIVVKYKPKKAVAKFIEQKGLPKGMDPEQLYMALKVIRKSMYPVYEGFNEKWMKVPSGYRFFIPYDPRDRLGFIGVFFKDPTILEFPEEDEVELTAFEE